MRILVYGAGNIGSVYAALLARSGQEVSLLARGARLERLRANGVELEDAVRGGRTVIPVRSVERLDSRDRYDVVVVALPRQVTIEVLPVLAANEQTPSFLFFGHNVAGPAEMVSAVGRERVLLGFPGAAGFPREGAVRYLITSAREQPTTIGELDGERSPRIRAVAAAFEQAGFPAAISPDMDSWLKTHAAEIVPTVGALFLSGGDRMRMTRTRDSLLLMLRGIREGFRVLRRLRIPIVPGGHRVFEWIPEPILLSIMRRMIRSDEAEVKIGHAAAGRDEWRQIAGEFGRLVAKSGLQTPALDRLYHQLEPGAEPLADGSARIPLSWRLAPR